MPELHVLRVFVGDDGTEGNALGVFLDGGAVPERRRQAIATDLGFSETVYVEDRSRGTVRIFTPGAELQFAGHPLVGTSWLLARESTPVDVLRTGAGDVVTWTEGDLTWIRGRDEWCPPFELRQLDAPSEVNALEAPPAGAGGDLVDWWAWTDESHGEIRSRVFAPDVGISEDQATGSAALRLGHALGRPLLIRQGRGSVLHVRPGPDGTVEVGGRTVFDERRDYEV